MISRSTDALIEQLASEARPVEPLAPPLTRATATLAGLGLACALAVLLFADPRELLARYAGREAVMLAEMGAMLATGMLAVTGAFFASVPGRSRRWLYAPLPPFLTWLALSGIGCFGQVAPGGAGGTLGHSRDCLIFILAAGCVMAAPLIWLLSRAAPIDPVPVALLGGLGSAASAAFMLQFFHPFTVTFLDLAVHLVAILLVVAATGLLNRRTLGPA